MYIYIYIKYVMRFLSTQKYFHGRICLYRKHEKRFDYFIS